MTFYWTPEKGLTLEKEWLVITKISFFISNISFFILFFFIFILFLFLYLFWTPWILMVEHTAFAKKKHWMPIFCPAMFLTLFLPTSHLIALKTSENQRDQKGTLGRKGLHSFFNEFCWSSRQDMFCKIWLLQNFSKFCFSKIAGT